MKRSLASFTYGSSRIFSSSGSSAFSNESLKRLIIIASNVSCPTLDLIPELDSPVLEKIRSEKLLATGEASTVRATLARSGQSC